MDDNGYVALSEKVTATFYDDEHEEWTQKTMTIADILDSVCDDYTTIPSAQPETYKEKLKEIADALSEKFAYMNTCLNERDIILGYLGVKRPSKTHCNTDCTNIKCESYRYNKRLPSAQAEINTDEDTISRQDAIESVLKLTYADGAYGYADAKELVDSLEALPYAQPERKNGKWIGYDGDWLKTMCKCSECGAMIDINEKYRNFFCYHCGAKMER